MIRYATRNDLEALILLGATMHAESPRYRRFPYRPDKLAALAEPLLQGDNGIAVVSVNGDNVVGMLLGVCMEHYFTDSKVVTDVATYVLPAYRGGRSFLGMVTAFEERAKELGAVEISLGISAELATDSLVKIYERLGYRRAAVGMVKDV
jgi:GNAT superfamily N-acetyltransferase